MSELIGRLITHREGGHQAMVQTTSRLDRFLYELSETRGFVNSSEGVAIAYSRVPWDSVLVLSGVIS